MEVASQRQKSSSPIIDLTSNLVPQHTHHLRLYQSCQTRCWWNPQQWFHGFRCRLSLGWPAGRQGNIKALHPGGRAADSPWWCWGARAGRCSHFRPRRRVWNTSAVCVPSFLASPGWEQQRTPWSLCSRPAETGSPLRSDARLSCASLVTGCRIISKPSLTTDCYLWHKALSQIISVQIVHYSSLCEGVGGGGIDDSHRCPEITLEMLIICDGWTVLSGSRFFFLQKKFYAV